MRRRGGLTGWKLEKATGGFLTSLGVIQKEHEGLASPFLHTSSFLAGRRESEKLNAKKFLPHFALLGDELILKLLGACVGVFLVLSAAEGKPRQVTCPDMCGNPTAFSPLPSPLAKGVISSKKQWKDHLPAS